MQKHINAPSVHPSAFCLRVSRLFRVKEGNSRRSNKRGGKYFPSLLTKLLTVLNALPVDAHFHRTVIIIYSQFMNRITYI